jgi:hypothetical protein
MFFVGARLQKKFPGRRADERTGIFLRFRSISLPHYYISISVFSQKNGALKSGDAIPADLSFTKEEQ